MKGFERFQEFIEAKLPDPLTFALTLTALMAFLALTLTPTEPPELLMLWGDSLSSLLTFTMQIGLTIILAYVLSQTPLMQSGLRRLAALARTPTQAYVLVILTAATFYLISWPLGPISGALVAREIAKDAVARNNPVHFPLMAVGALSGYAVWEMGYSSSIALAVATEGNPTHDIIGRLIPIQETLLTHWNLLSIATTLAVIIATVLALHRQFDLKKPYIPEDLVTPLERLPEVAPDLKPPQGRRHWSLLTGLLLVAYVVGWFAQQGLALELNIVNWTFMALGLLLVRSLSHYSVLFADGAQVAAPTLLQYPLYAGIMGMAIQSGLAQQFTQGLIGVATHTTLPVIAFLSAGLINIFIPSGGAQWALQGPAFIEAAKLLEVDLGLIAMSVAYGDQWTNLIQPFVAIPLLALTGLRLKHIFGLALVLCAATSLPLITGLLIGNLQG
ncbi:TIGR00366 family protein [Luminiphilus sp. nBUS_07]|uniref:TIGR00366 family protein n=1 Tax=Luminiphilus sp. nBUS_07 TaxID=3395314 RepID=UPI003EC040B6